MKQIGILFLLVTMALGMYSCIQIDEKFQALPPGPWRGVLKLPLEQGPNTLSASAAEEEVKEYSVEKRYRELPFIFNVHYVTQDSFYIEIINGEEKIMVSDIIYELDRSTAKDTLTINFPAYDTYIKAIYEETFIEGAWYINYKESYSIPFIAYQGQNKRFKVSPKKPSTDLTGEWDVVFDHDKGEDAYPARGVFKQEGARLTGTFKTETGDYRFLEGTVADKKFYLSVFDGAHAFLFEGKETGEDEITGQFLSGKHYLSNWVATRSKEDSNLKNPYKLSQATTDKPISFSFKNPDGQVVSLNDDQFNGKPKLINVMGTWCPNCRDEVNFLKEHYKEITDAGFEIITLGFERYRDEAKSRASLKKYQSTMNVPWTMLHGGYYDKSEATEILPFVDKVISYPTLFFLDKNNKVVKVHTGFNGPATEEFAGFKKEFFDLINSIK